MGKEMRRMGGEGKEVEGRGEELLNGGLVTPLAAARIRNSLPTARHFCTFVACLLVTPQDSSLHHFLSQFVTMYSAAVLAQ